MAFGNALLLAAALAAGGVPPAAFPPLAGRTLLGENETLPQALAGRPALVFVAFRRAQQDQVVSWLPLVERLTAREPSVAIVQVPVLPKVARPFGSFIEARFRNAISGDAARHATLIVYGDPAAVAHELGLRDGSDAAEVVLDAAGRIAWLGHGSYDENAAREAQQTLEDLRR